MRSENISVASKMGFTPKVNLPDSLAFRASVCRLITVALVENISRVSEADYLRMERQSETRNEYFDGEIFAMAGGTRTHSLIAANKDASGFNADIKLASLGVVLRLSEVFAKVQFTPARLRTRT